MACEKKNWLTRKNISQDETKTISCFRFIDTLRYSNRPCVIYKKVFLGGDFQLRT